MAERWDPHDRSALEQIRRFELDQPSATAEVLGAHLAALQMAQTILLNVTARVLQLSNVADEDTPVLFLPHTIIDDLRQVELNLALGYTVPAAIALRDAIEACALCALFSKEPDHARPYFDGEEFKPSDVRKRLLKLGLNKGFVAYLWFMYDFLSRFAHPNVDRLAHVMDERMTPEGVIRTYNAGATRAPNKLRLIGQGAMGALVPLLLLTTDALARFLSDQDNAIVRATIRDLTAKCGPLVATAVSSPAIEEPDESRAYTERLRRRFARQRELLDAALADLKVDGHE